jgi:hypothetical protein
MILRRTARGVKRRGVRQVNEDGMSGRKPRNDAEAKDLMVWSESRGQSWPSHPEDLKVGFVQFVDTGKRIQRYVPSPKDSNSSSSH